MYIVGSPEGTSHEKGNKKKKKKKGLPLLPHHHHPPVLFPFTFSSPAHTCGRTRQDNTPDATCTRHSPRDTDRLYNVQGFLGQSLSSHPCSPPSRRPPHPPHSIHPLVLDSLFFADPNLHLVPAVPHIPVHPFSPSTA